MFQIKQGETTQIYIYIYILAVESAILQTKIKHKTKSRDPCLLKYREESQT